MTNVPEYFEVVWAARRGGYFYTAVNWHLTPGEVRYMLENSESKALIVSADLADVAEQAAADLPRLTLRLLVGAGPRGLGGLRAGGRQCRRRPRSARNSRGRPCSIPRGLPAGRKASCTPTWTWTAGSAT